MMPVEVYAMTNLRPVNALKPRRHRRHRGSKPESGDRFKVTPLDPELEHLSWERLVLRKMSAPSWMTSLAFHVGLLLILAWCILPSVRKPNLVMVGETVPAAELQELEFTPIQIESNDLQLAPELEEPEFEDLDMFEDLHLEPEGFEPANFADEFDQQMIEHDATRSASVDAESERKNQSAVGREAAEIQDRVVNAGGKNGEVQFSLVWKTITDLDLHVVTPSGERVCYTNRRSRCQGNLDVDRNARETTTSPVENVRWLQGQPASGRYTVIIHLYRLRGQGAVKYDLMAKTGQEIDLQKNKRIMLNDRLQVYRYVYFAPGISESMRSAEKARLQRLQEEEELLASDLLKQVKPGDPREQMLLMNVARRYPHTDAAIAALQRLSGRATK